MERRFELVVPTDAARQRLEDILLDEFTTVSKMYLRELVREEKCEVNGRNENIGYRVRPGDLILVNGSRGIGTDLVVDRLKVEFA